jgi:L-ribulose-5-phosphate 3-epimerase
VNVLEDFTPTSTQFGIMQGRLVPPDAGRFQSFPRARWRDEFPNAVAAGINYIEWIVDDYGLDVNPLFTEAGLDELDSLKREHGITTPAICADWFMDFPFLRCSPEQRSDREQFLYRLLPIASSIGADHVVIPFVDISRIETEEEKQIVVEIMTAAAPIAAANGVELHLETDLGPGDFAALLERIPHPCVKANYDSGNSSGLGYIASEEFAAYGDRIGSIHIKDRRSKFAGGIATMPLGEGSADLPSVFACMKQIDYERPITLQVARGEDGDEVNWIRRQLAFIHRYWR